MPITFIPNDPKAKGGPPTRTQAARAERAGNVAGFTYVGHAAAAEHSLGSPEFLFWQSREAALTALQLYESLQGGKVAQWARSQPDARKLALRPNDGVELNAYYTGRAILFYEYTTGTKTTWSGASTDVVAHEVGHAVLDQSRPDLWDFEYPETSAFHESFGDCLALLTALNDPATRDKVRTKLRKPNFVEKLSEDLSDGVRRALGASHPAAKPRRARNTFQWALPSRLPRSGPPDVLSSESHSFSRVFTGCFYDVLLNVVADLTGSSKAPTSQQLSDAALIAGRLLVRAAAEAPESARFFQAVGRAMVLADEATNGGTHRQAISDGFQKHNIGLGSSAMLAPVAAVGGPTAGRSAVSRGELSQAVKKDLRKRLGAAPNEAMMVARHEIAGEKMIQATHVMQVPLGQLDKRLQGVFALAPQPVLVGVMERQGAAAILGGVPDPATSEDEVKTFVATLLEANRIAFDQKDREGMKSKKRGDVRLRLPTHEIRQEGAKKVLRRMRFAC